VVTRDYELGFILNPEVNEDQTRSILGRVEQIVTNHGGQIVRVNQWGRRRLSYPIEHHRDGFYVFIDMILTPETVAELDRTLKVSEDVLRHLMKRRDPKAVQKEREEREARAAAAAAVAATPAASAATAEVAKPTAEEPAAEADEEAIARDETGASIVLTDEEEADVPPAIEDDETD